MKFALRSHIGDDVPLSWPGGGGSNIFFWISPPLLLNCTKCVMWILNKWFFRILNKEGQQHLPDFDEILSGSENVNMITSNASHVSLWFGYLWIYIWIYFFTHNIDFVVVRKSLGYRIHTIHHCDISLCSPGLKFWIWKKTSIFINFFWIAERRTSKWGKENNPKE